MWTMVFIAIGIVAFVGLSLWLLPDVPAGMPPRQQEATFSFAPVVQVVDAKGLERVLDEQREKFGRFVAGAGEDVVMAHAGEIRLPAEVADAVTCAVVSADLNRRAWELFCALSHAQVEAFVRKHRAAFAKVLR